jgi:hypothetical protein
MMTVHKCQAVLVAGSWRNPRAKLMAIIVASVSIAPHLCRDRTESHGATRRLSHGSPDDDDESDKQDRFDDHVFDPFCHTIHRGSTGHSGQENPGFDVKRYPLPGDVIFLQRLLVGRTRSSGVKLVPFRRNGQMFAVKPQASSWTSAHAQGYFSAIILMLVAFDGFTLSCATRHSR